MVGAWAEKNHCRTPGCIIKLGRKYQTLNHKRPFNLGPPHKTARKYSAPLRRTTHHHEVGRRDGMKCVQFQNSSWLFYFGREEHSGLLKGYNYYVRLSLVNFYKNQNIYSLSPGAQLCCWEVWGSETPKKWATQRVQLQRSTGNDMINFLRRGRKFL